MDTKTFASTPEKLQELANMLASHGVILNPNEAAGEVNEKGWDVSWYQVAGFITFSLVKHPFAAAGFFWSKLADILGPAL